MTYTSANTSINSTKLPAVYRKIENELKNYKVIFDYGCGKYTDHIQDYATEHGIFYIGVDPYNKGQVENLTSMTMLKHLQNLNEPVLFICSNVVNVIKEKVDRTTLYRLLINNMQYGDKAYISVYEGDLSGNGRETKPDCWQNNLPLEFYREEISAIVGKEIKKEKGMIIL